MIVRRDAEDRTIVSSFLWNVTDRRTDGQDRQIDSPWTLPRSALRAMRTRCKKSYQQASIPCSNDFRYNQGVLKLMAGHCAPYTIYRVTSHLRLLFLSILTCNLNMRFLALLVSDNSRSLKKFEFGALSPATPKKKITWDLEFFIATCASDLTFLA